MRLMRLVTISLAASLALAGCTDDRDADGANDDELVTDEEDDVNDEPFDGGDVGDAGNGNTGSRSGDDGGIY